MVKHNILRREEGVESLLEVGVLVRQVFDKRVHNKQHIEIAVVPDDRLLLLDEQLDDSRESNRSVQSVHFLLSDQLIALFLLLFSQIIYLHDFFFRIIDLPF